MGETQKGFRGYISTIELLSLCPPIQIVRATIQRDTMLNITLYHLIGSRICLLLSNMLAIDMSLVQEYVHTGKIVMNWV